MIGTGEQPPIEIHCPAKLNLTLAVGTPRADGLHPIASVMVALAFGDSLSLARPTMPTSQSTIRRRFANDAPKSQAIDWPIERDLMFRAHALMQDEVGEALPIDCRLTKRIPVGAGLGGGSSNAAGMLVGLRKHFGLAVSDARLVELGQTLGADVGFLVHAHLGCRAALVTGIGEVITPLPTSAKRGIVLIFPEGTCPTAKVYGAFDEGHGTPTPIARLAEYGQQWEAADQLPKPMNDLADAAAEVCPEIENAKESLLKLNYKSDLTGSGSALFVLSENACEARQIAEQTRKAGLAAIATRFL